MNAATSNFHSVRKEWPEKARNVLCNVFVLIGPMPGPKFQNSFASFLFQVSYVGVTRNMMLLSDYWCYTVQSGVPKAINERCYC
jgi:hypothetical protein